MLLDSSLIARLDLLSLVSRHPQSGGAAGPRRSARSGSSVEFRDFRDYHPGDDFRRVDWSAFARMDRLFLRLYTAEENATVTLLLDISASMGTGQPSKFDLGRRLCAALAYIALGSDDRVGVGLLDNGLHAMLPYRSGRARAAEIWRYLENSTSAGQTDLARSLRSAASYARASRGGGSAGGLCVVVSDLLTPSDWRAGLQALRAAGQDVTVIQILATEEIDPPMRGDFALVDSETGERREVSLTPHLVNAYRQRLATYQASIATYCHSHNIAVVTLTNTMSLDDILLRTLRRAGVTL